MWIKICANTNLEDTQMAAELGADAVGFVFAPSKRRVTIAQVATITPHLPSAVERVGVVSSGKADEIVGIALGSGLTAVQLHMELDQVLTEDLASRLQGRVRLIQVLHWPIESDSSEPATRIAEAMSAQLQAIAAAGFTDTVLIDSKVGAASGGTGVSFEWDAAAAIFRRPPAGLRVIAAGGLNAENVGEAIERLDPWGVDVASGVESEPGRKDPEKLARFIQRARLGRS